MPLALAYIITTCAVSLLLFSIIGTICIDLLSLCYGYWSRANYCQIARHTRSQCNLNIEKGRYLKLPVEQRICQLCHTDVEDEFHFLMNCDKLIHERVTLFRNISDIVPSFTKFYVKDKISFIYSRHVKITIQQKHAHKLII